MKVYLAHSPSLGLIKIGCAENPRRRVRHLTVECGHYASVLLIMPGNRKRERALHRRFRASAVSNEWFRPEGKLAAFLESRGHGHVVGRAINATIVGRMKRKYTMRLKRAREDYHRRWGKDARRHYIASAPPPKPKSRKARK